MDRTNCKTLPGPEFEVCEQGSCQYNEDRIGYTESSAWVIDGATDLFHLDLTGANTDVSFLAESLSRKLKEKTDPDYLPEELLTEAVRDVRKRFPDEGRSLDRYPEYMQPQFAIALCSLKKDILHYLILGDCSLCLDHEGHRTWLTDHRLDLFNRRNRQGLEQLKKDSGFTKEKELTVLQDTRKFANARDGYWIGSLSAAGILHAMEGKLKLEEGDRILLCSDGFTEYFNLPDTLGRDQLPFERKEIQKALDLIDQTFDSDTDRSRIIREKNKDDKSVLLFQI